MTRKLRVSAETLRELRDFLAETDVDMGCRPVAVRHGGGYATEVLAQPDESDALAARRIGTIQIEVLEELPTKSARTRMVRTSNRFLGGRPPRGLGVKE